MIPSYRDAKLVAQLVAKIRQTTDRDRVRIVVADDASGPEHLAALRQIDGIEVVAGEQNAGFATNVNRGLRATDPRHDVVLLNSDVVPLRDWLACLQYATTHRSEIGIVGAKLLYPDNRIQYAGTIRNAEAPEWFDHRYRFKPADWGPADIAGPTLAATGACMYIARGVLDQVGLFDEEYGMGYEDVDYCLRAWQAGYQVVYAPSARLHHHESITRGTSVGERERKSQRVFWRRWGTFFDERPVLNDDGRLRVVYVAQDTDVFGGVRVVFEHLNGLTERGHDAAAVDAGKRTRLVRAPLPGAELPRLRRARRRTRPAAGDQGRDLVGDRHPGLARERRQRFAGLPRPGHRDQLLPRSPHAPIRGAGHLSARVQVPHHLDLESSPPGGVGVGRRVDFPWR